MKKELLILVLMLGALSTKAQTLTPFDSLHWSIQGKEVKLEDFQGKKCLKIVDGAANLKDNFENGIIEFDINFEKGRSFPGLMFRVVDDKNFEFVYIRPHQSGNPDAIQYCPIIFGSDSWQLYSGEGFTAQKEFSYNIWTHIKVIIGGTRAELYFNNEALPTLYMYQLQRTPIKGILALDNHSSSVVRFANFSYSKQDNPPMKSIPKITKPLEAGYVANWNVSNVFEDKILENKFILSKADLQDHQWQKLAVEDLGFINIGKSVMKTAERNTVFTKFSLESKNDEIKKMSLGFSDRCKVYLNGKLIYGGNNTFRSRDYRFYGTIGFWDEIYLDLSKGNNVVVIAVSENFGGWGVEAKFDDMNDLTFSDQ